MTAPSTVPLAQPLRWLAAFQGACSPLIGFAGLLVYQSAGMAATLRYTAVMLASIVVAIAAGLLWGQRRRWQATALARWGFWLPAALLPLAPAHPWLLALAVGSFIGLISVARQWIELSVLTDAERDPYAAEMTVWGIGGNLLATVLISSLLSWRHDNPHVLYGGYAVLLWLGGVLAVRHWPPTPAIKLHRPTALLQHPGWNATLGLYFVESGLLGVGMVMGAAAAGGSVQHTSHYGWAASAATVVGALSLLALRRHRHVNNRIVWMGWAAVGMATAYSLLGASAHWPWLWLPHLLWLAVVQPFWIASEQVLNQRALDLHAPLADRILVRETTLGLMRVGSVLAFGFLTEGWSVPLQLGVGASTMAVVLLWEWWIARAWLRAAASNIKA